MYAPQQQQVLGRDVKDGRDEGRRVGCALSRQKAFCHAAPQLQLACYRSPMYTHHIPPRPHQSEPQVLTGRIGCDEGRVWGQDEAAVLCTSGGALLLQPPYSFPPGPPACMAAG